MNDGPSNFNRGKTKLIFLLYFDNSIFLSQIHEIVFFKY